MKLFIIISALFLLVSCNSNTRLGGASNAICDSKNLELATYDLKLAEPLKIPNDATKADNTPAPEGRYILIKSMIHIYDKNVKAPAEDFLQYMVVYNAKPKKAKDIKKNQQVYSPSIGCIYGLDQFSNGTIDLQANFPLELNITANGDNIEPTLIKATNIKYTHDFNTTIEASDLNNKSIDSIDKINSGENAITKFSQEQAKDITKGNNKSDTELKNENVFQLQNQVSKDNRVITTISTFKRCLQAEETEGFDKKTSDEIEQLEKDFETCMSVELITEDRL